MHATFSRRSAMKLAAASAVGCAVRGAFAADATRLAPTSFRPLALGSVMPMGWLHDQLRVQADGMGGHLDEFWPDVGSNSGWLGGTGESWERGPYFLDGLLPLAVLLNDSRLQAKADAFVEWTLTHQQDDGMIGPATNNDWWPRMVMAKALAQHHEATGDARVLDVLTKYFHYQLAELPNRPLKSWGRFRWQDEVLVVEWLHDRTGDPELLKLARLLEQQGFDWQAEFAAFPFEKATDKTILNPVPAGSPLPERAMQAHGVNNGQALKVAAVQYRLTGDRGQRDAYFRQLALLDRYHGLPNGIFSCDEHLSGRSPSQGSELCTVVETMYSMEVALAAFGDAVIGDRIEKLAFNALPGTFTDDMWAHQYDQQPNQVQCSLNSKPWSTNGVESNLYGLAPHFGCCTANFHQGWPKFAANLWMATADDGVAAALYAPCQVKTAVRGTAVKLTVTTEYPFRDTIHILVNAAKPTRFPILLRIPEWANGTEIRINNAPAQVAARPGTFARLERVWSAEDRVELRLPMQPRITRWDRNSVAVEAGPLVFSHDPGTSWVKLRDHSPTADWQVFPTGAWNYAIAADETSAAELKLEQHAVPPIPFGSKNPAITIAVRARRYDAWRSEDGVAQPVPASPVVSQNPDETLRLVPYAGAKLRVTAFPVLKS